MSCIEFTLNGEKCSVDTQIPRDTSLNAFLRYHRGLPGTKSMCHQGSCGACVVAVRAYNHTSGKVETFSVSSCLVLVFTCQGWEITTIEGVGNRRSGYHEIQTRAAGFSSTQCGYCTSGWEMLLFSLLDKNLTMAELEDSVGTSTCRCTGYRPILDTAKSFAVDASAELCDKVREIESLCKCDNIQKTCERKNSSGSDDDDWSIIDKLAISDSADMIQLDFVRDGTEQKYFKVYNKIQIFQILRQHGSESCMLLDGNTARGILGIYDTSQHVIDIREVSSLKQYEIDQNLVLGANMSMQDCITLFKNVSKTRLDFAYLDEFAKHLLLVANVSIRTMGSLAGNIIIKYKKPSFQSDIYVLFAAVCATVTIKDAFGRTKELSLPELLKTNMSGFLIENFKLPPFGQTHVFKSYKILPRSQNASATVNAAFLLNISKKNIIEFASIVYGNISETFTHAANTEKYLVGKNVFNDAVLQGAIKLLDAEVVPAVDATKPTPECRKTLAIGLFYKFILSISPKGFPSPRLRSGGALFKRPVSSGKQQYETNSSLYPVNQPLQKYEGLIQCSGEAQYANDIPPMKNEVFGAFVLSTVHNAELDCVDATEVLKIKGVLALYTAKDIPGINSFTLPGSALHTQDEEMLASKKILFYGQPVAIIVAESEMLAAKVAKKVKVTYKNVSVTAPVITIDEAKKDSKRLVASDNKIVATGKGTNTTKVIKGMYEVGAQYHYYMEPLSCVVVPVDHGLEVFDASQWVDLTQNAIARCLDMNESEVFVKVRRVGGGFGGKLTRNVQVATACALIAKKMNRPSRFILPLSTNITVAGRRLPSQCEYEVGVDDNGVIQYLDASIIADKGCSLNENTLSYTISGFKNCYKTDYFNLKTSVVLTDLSANTAFRGPGTLEGMATMEHIMDHIAFVVKKDPTNVRLVNMRSTDNDIPQLIETLKKESDYDRRCNEIQQYNKANRWVKKAIKINVVLFPVEYYGNYTTMVSIFRDGTVTVTTGGIEVGQGAYTKVRQVVARELGISVNLVTILPYFGFIAANNIYTGGSIVSECISYAAIKACAELNTKLEPVRNSLENPTWLEITQRAWELQMDLVAKYMMSQNEPDLANYSAFTVTCLEGQLDVLTGRYMLNRLDMLQDVGTSLNPAVDIGQLEGAYVQGLSYFTSEKLVFDKNTGRLISDDALSYIVNLAKDIPVQMNVSLRKNSRNTTGVLGSKAVGEMAICSGHGVTHVLRQCIMESRKDSGYDPNEWINIDVPYTAQSILKALSVKPSELVLKN